MTRPIVVGFVLSILVVTGASGAWACPAPPGWPDEPTMRDMIRAGSTGIDRLPMLLLGRVRGTRDLRGGPNGYAIARFRVAEDAIGRVAGSVRVRFYRPKPSEEDAEQLSPHAVLDRGERWALVSRRRADGVVGFGLICTESQQLGERRLRSLVRLARRV
jgi:hypothetical protein